MGSIWLLVLITVLNTGEVTSSIRFTTDPAFNNEKSCNEAGQAYADKAQAEIGTANGKAYWKCDEYSLDEMLKASKATTKSNGQSL